MEEKIFSIVRNLEQYGYYKKKAENAAAVLKRAYPTIEKNICLQIINFYQQQYIIIAEKVRNDKSIILPYYHDNNIEQWLNYQNLDTEVFYKEITLQHQQILRQIANFLVEWIIIR